MQPLTEKSVQKALARLVTRGVDSVWLPEVQPLFELPAVRAKVAELGDDHAAEALREVLLAATEELGQSQYRSLLKIVLGLEPEYADMAAGRKREIAGRRFRGGKSPVGAGTIRQHHEPRAIEALSALLLAPESRKEPSYAGSLTDKGSSRLEWHPSVRAGWAGERLSFWRLSLGDYDSATAVESLAEAIRNVGANAWSVHETLGLYDLLLRLWLPAGATPREFERALTDAFGSNLHLFDRFDVDEVVADWPWISSEGMRQPAPEVLANPLPQPGLDYLDRAEHEAMLATWRDRNLVTEAREQAGIGFMLTVAASRPAMAASLGRGDLVLDQVNEVLASASGELSEISLYRGSGFADYLVQGRVRPDAFPAIKERLADPLNRHLSTLGYRVYAFVMATGHPVSHEAGLPGGSGAGKPSARALLVAGEGPRVEIRGFAFADPRSRSGPPRGGGIESLGRHVAAFLNCDGGTIVVGAYEKESVRQDRDLEDLPLLAGAPTVGNCLVPGIDQELEQGYDRFLRRLRDALAQAVDPDPNLYLSATLESIEGRTVCVIEVGSPGGGAWFYARPRAGEARFMIRTGAVTRELKGAEADSFKLQRANAPR